MRSLQRFYVRIRNGLRGQTMTEYTLILAAVAIAVFVTYEVLGQDIMTMVNKVNTLLTTNPG